MSVSKHPLYLNDCYSISDSLEKKLTLFLFYFSLLNSDVPFFYYYNHNRWHSCAEVAREGKGQQEKTPSTNEGNILASSDKGQVPSKKQEDSKKQ